MSHSTISNYKIRYAHCSTASIEFLFPIFHLSPHIIFILFISFHFPQKTNTTSNLIKARNVKIFQLILIESTLLMNFLFNWKYRAKVVSIFLVCILAILLTLNLVWIYDSMTKTEMWKIVFDYVLLSIGFNLHWISFCIYWAHICC